MSAIGGLMSGMGGLAGQQANVGNFRSGGKAIPMSGAQAGGQPGQPAEDPFGGFLKKLLAKGEPAPQGAGAGDAGYYGGSVGSGLPPPRF
jgi:hypothetical protein